MIGNALGYAAVTCIVVMATGCANPDAGVRSTESDKAPVRDYTLPAPSPQSDSADAPAEVAPSPITLEPETPETSQKGAGPAVVLLLKRAQQEDEANKTHQAVATIERALQIEPRNPRLYRQLAIYRLKLGQADQAEGMALKSNSLAGSDRQLQMQNWTLIARCRRAQQNEQGAVEAERKIQMLRMRGSSPQ